MNKGFTLIELLVVVTIIAILSSIGISIYSGAIKRTNQVKIRSDLESIAKTYETGFVPETNTYTSLDVSNFPGGEIPKSPAGGSYIVYGPDNQANPQSDGFAVCSDINTGLVCYDPFVSSCLCKTSTKGETDPAVLLATPTPAPTATPMSFPSSGLISYWNLDETNKVGVAGGILDSSDGNHGTIPAGAVVADVIPGKIGNGKSFNGSNNSRIDIGDKANLELTTFTISGWIKLSGACAFNTCPILSKGQSGNTGYSLEIANSKAVLNIRDGLDKVTGITNIPIGEWHHIVGTADGTTLRVYVDSVKDGEKTQTAIPAFGVESAKIGTRNGGSDITTNGVIDEVGIWNRVLTQQEITNVYNSTVIVIPPPSPTPTPAPLPASYTPKVLLVIYNPIIESQGSIKLSILRGWNDPDNLTADFINSVKTASGNVVNYSVVERIEVDGIPVKNDGFQYTDSTYLTCVSSGGPGCHSPDLASYQAMIQLSDACTKRNNGTIDELWIWGGPWFGYWESNLAGPGAFSYNSPPTTGTACNQLLPIMGFSYERGEAEMFEDLGHRLEAVMRQVYGFWSADYGVSSATINHNWDKFSILNLQNPGNGGCGNAHMAVNSSIVIGYDRTNSNIVLSSCEDFLNYPSFTGLKTNVSCSNWGCSTLGYLKWMFGHLPRASGTGPDGKLNNWWKYIVDY